MCLREGVGGAQRVPNEHYDLRNNLSAPDLILSTYSYVLLKVQQVPGRKLPASRQQGSSVRRRLEQHASTHCNNNAVTHFTTTCRIT